MMELFSAENLVAFLTLAGLEIVLGIDNIVFIAILCGRLPEQRRDSARRVGLGLAMFMRIGLLLSISWIMTLNEPLFDVSALWGGGGEPAATMTAAAAETGPADGHGASVAGAGVHGKGHNPWAISGKDLILLLGGLFLVAKSTYEIHHKLEGAEGDEVGVKKGVSYGGVIVQILLLDLVFSLDSVITAVGMVKVVPGKEWMGLTVMIAAVVVAVVVMLVFSGPVVRFVDRHPTMKMLALAFLLLIGVMLTVEAFEGHVPKGYIYFAMAFSLGVELLNIGSRRKKKVEAVRLRNQVPTTPEAAAQLPGKR